MEGLDSTAGIIAAAAGAVALVALAVAASSILRLRRLRRDQRTLLGEGEERDLVAHAVALQRRVEELGQALEEVHRGLSARVSEAEVRLDGSVSRTAVLRYDAFNESTGRQSSSVALLDERDNGVVISAITQREQARVYAKPISAGESSLELSPEETEAMRMARQGQQE